MFSIIMIIILSVCIMKNPDVWLNHDHFPDDRWLNLQGCLTCLSKSNYPHTLLEQYCLKNLNNPVYKVHRLTLFKKIKQHF